MNFDPRDAELREQFRRLRQQDQQRAPSFSSLTARAARPWAFNYRLVAVALSLLLVLAIVAFIRSRRPTASLEQLSQWRSPTGSLLRTPGAQLLDTTPRFGGNLNLLKTEIR
jgi:hypothetical protein